MTRLGLGLMEFGFGSSPGEDLFSIGRNLWRISCFRFYLRQGWSRERRIVGFGRLGVFKRFQLILPIFMLGRIVRWFLLRLSVGCGDAKSYLLLFLLLGGCLKISLILGSFWKGEGCRLKILCVVCVGRRKNLIAICFSIVVLFGAFGVYALSGLEFRLCFTLILSQTLTNSS